MPLWRALRVIAGARRRRARDGLEPPFVGRDRELRLVKELFHATRDERRRPPRHGRRHRRDREVAARVGVREVHRRARRRRLLAPGPLPGLRRRRRVLGARRDGAHARRNRRGGGAERRCAKLRATLEDNVPDADERGWIEPRLAHLLGLAERGRRRPRRPLRGLAAVLRAPGRAAARRCSSSRTCSGPTRPARLHRAICSTGRAATDSSCSRWRGPSWPSGGRVGRGGAAYDSLSLEPLAPRRWTRCSTGRPRAARRAAVADPRPRRGRSAVRGRDGAHAARPRPARAARATATVATGEIDALDVPETLHALIAARLDGLMPEERRVVQDAAVLGKTFTAPALAALADAAKRSSSRPRLAGPQGDPRRPGGPRSPERGQYRFLQDLLKRIAYETLARKDRKARHLAAARHLEQAWGPADQEVVEVVAAHYLDAYAAAPEAEDAAEIRARRSSVSSARASAPPPSPRAKRRSTTTRRRRRSRRTDRSRPSCSNGPECGTEGGRIEEAMASLEGSIELSRRTGPPRGGACRGPPRPCVLAQRRPRRGCEPDREVLPGLRGRRARRRPGSRRAELGRLALPRGLRLRS